MIPSSACFEVILLLSVWSEHFWHYPAFSLENQDFYLLKDKKNALDRNNPRERMEKLKRRNQGAELFFPGSYKFMVLGVLPHDPQWQSGSLLPDTQTQKPGGHFA